MINPTHEDIGRGVVYQASYPDAPREDGTITRIIDSETVFVSYKGQPKATSCCDLEWACG